MLNFHYLQKDEKNSSVFKNPCFTHDDPYFLAYYKKKQQGRGLITYDIYTIVLSRFFLLLFYSIRSLIRLATNQTESIFFSSR